MSAGAAAAMRAVLHEVGSATAGGGGWRELEMMLEDLGPFGSCNSADGAAAAHSRSARVEAARKLIGNHKEVLKDVTNK